MKRIARPSPWIFAGSMLTGFALVGCQRTPPPGRAEQALPSAYASRHFNDPALREIAEGMKKWALQQTGTKGQPLYRRAEVLPPVQIVQPYGVGAFEQEPRLSVILTIGPGWKELKIDDKEAKAREAFVEMSKRLQPFQHKPPLRPTLTIQTPQGMELAWINHLDPSGKNLHGDD